MNLIIATMNTNGYTKTKGIKFGQFIKNSNIDILSITETTKTNI